MPKVKVTDEIRTKILQFKRRGLNYSEIGRELGLDRRTVKATADRIDRTIDSEHWQSVLRDVDADLLRLHYQMFGDLILAFQDTIDEASISEDSPDLEASRYFDLSFFKAFSLDDFANEVQDVDQNGYARIVRKVTPERVRTLGDRLLSGLSEHEPEFTRALSDWKNKYDQVQNLKRKLKLIASNSLDSVPTDSSILCDWVVREVMLNTLSNSGWGRFDIAISNGNLTVGRVIPSVDAIKNVFQGSSSEVEAFSRKYEVLLEELAASNVMIDLRDEYVQIKASIQTLAGLADVILLRGRPNGRCHLCPYVLV